MATPNWRKDAIVADILFNNSQYAQDERNVERKEGCKKKYSLFLSIAEHHVDHGIEGMVQTLGPSKIDRQVRSSSNRPRPSSEEGNRSVDYYMHRYQLWETKRRFQGQGPFPS